MKDFEQNILEEKKLRKLDFIVYYSYISNYIKVFTTNSDETIDIINTIYDDILIDVVSGNILKVFGVE